jgi:nucleoside-diphosphate-sugar epimerase
MRGDTRVLVTGAGGFIGSHLVPFLVEKGCSVVALDVDLTRVRHLEQRQDLRLVEADFTDPEVQYDLLPDVDFVFHLAAAHLGAFITRRQFWKVNVDGVRDFAHRAAGYGVQRFIHCSSVGVYGDHRDGVLDEQSSCLPDLPYDESKLAGEEAVRDAVAGSGLRAVILRPAWVYGPGCPRTAKLFRAIGKGYFPIVGTGQNRRHCIYIADMLQALWLAMLGEEAEGEMLIVGDESAVTIREIVEVIARLQDAREPFHVPLGIVAAAAFAAEMAFGPLSKEPPISRRSLRFFTSNCAFDTTRSQQVLGFDPRYDIHSGLGETHERLRRKYLAELGVPPSARPASRRL